MYYSLIGLLALLLLVLTNYDVLLRKQKKTVTAVQKLYRRFLLAVASYYITDFLWGILEACSLTKLLFYDTEIYFIAMALGILFWTQYVIAYLENDNILQKFLFYSGIVFFVSVVLLTILNLFFPVMFWFDETGLYHTGIARNITLLVQIVLLLLTAVFALYVSAHTAGTVKNRHFTIGLFGLIMLALIGIQFFEPYLPLYAIGYMLGCSLLRTFVIENEKEEYRQNLEEALTREKKELEDLNTAWRLAYMDSMTGTKSKLAFAEKEEQIDTAIDSGKAREMAVVVFDVNNLKEINDTLGHDAGDKYIISACELICDTFKHSPVFRVGGDEFVAILEGKDFINREELMAGFDRKMEENLKKNAVVIAAGLAVFDPAGDKSFRRVFERADLLMYQRKNELKN